MFRSARVTLTAWYVTILMTISLMFSLVIFTISVSEVRHFEQVQRYKIQEDLERNGCVALALNASFFPPTLTSLPNLMRESQQRIVWMLAGVNFALFFLSSIFSYILAGKTLQPIQKMVEDQHRFISDASHELRTPLTSLKTGFEVFLRDHRPSLEDAKTLAEESLTDVNSLQKLAESLLQLAQYEQKQSTVHHVTFPIIQAIETATKKLQRVMKEKNISLTVGKTSAIVKGDVQALSEAFVILLDNAIKYSPAESKISFLAHVKDKHIIIDVKDTGQGIDAKDLPKIFDRFYRSDAARTRTGTGGYGLGLSIAKKIIEAHHGRIKIASTLGQGTTVTITLPREVK